MVLHFRALYSDGQGQAQRVRNGCAQDRTKRRVRIGANAQVRPYFWSRRYRIKASTGGRFLQKASICYT